jgi:hypothetical protein
MTKVEASLPFLVKEGLENKKNLIDYYVSHTTLPCRQVGQEINHCLLKGN